VRVSLPMVTFSVRRAWWILRIDTRPSSRRSSTSPLSGSIFANSETLHSPGICCSSLASCSVSIVAFQVPVG
jgi:hypothetical protein